MYHKLMLFVQKNAHTYAGIMIDNDMTINKLSIGKNPQLKIIMQEGKKLTIEEKSSFDNIHIPVWIKGSLTDGQIIVHYQGYANDNTENMFTVLDDDAKIYYHQETKSHEISLAPQVKVIKEQSTEQKDIFSKFALQISGHLLKEKIQSKFMIRQSLIHYIILSMIQLLLKSHIQSMTRKLPLLVIKLSSNRMAGKNR